MAWRLEFSGLVRLGVQSFEFACLWARLYVSACALLPTMIVCPAKRHQNLFPEIQPWHLVVAEDTQP